MSQNDIPITPAPLEERFTPPQGWSNRTFHRVIGRNINFAHAPLPNRKDADAIIVCLPGLGEPSAKYHELARNCLDANMEFWVIDWMGQGASARHLDDPQKRHGSDFQNDIDDLDYWINHYIQTENIHDKPLVMIGHSMGANIGLQYLSQHQDVFSSAVFTAPMAGMADLPKLPRWLLKAALYAMKTFNGAGYVPDGGEWNPATRPIGQASRHSSHPIRAGVHSALYEAHPELQIGSITSEFLYHAYIACERLSDPALLSRITTPVLIALAGNEQIVTNPEIRNLAKHIPHAKLIEFDDALHEIWMEREEIREPFFQDAYAFIHAQLQIF